MSRKNLADETALEFSLVFEFSDVVVPITGAASGIGRAIAELFSGRGARLALIGKSPHIEIGCEYPGRWGAFLAGRHRRRHAGRAGCGRDRPSARPDRRADRQRRRWRGLASRGDFKRGLESSPPAGLVVSRGPEKLPMRGLASDAAAIINGANLVVDGGNTIC
jgi:NAD(P)-dependent dehydrogenase (short-subunit alcohol dehydrogenase family)